MRALRFKKLSEDGASLHLQDSDGVEYRIDIAEEIREAVRQWKERPRPQDHDQNQDLSVAEIQSRIRTGITAEDLAQVTGMQLNRIRKYEQPVLQERYFISQKAKATEIRRARGSAAFGDIVDSRVASGGGNSASMRWDSWRRDDGRWNIALAFMGKKGESEAHWVFDAAVSTIAPSNDVARWLLDVPEEESAEFITPRLVAVPKEIYLEETAELPHWVTVEGQADPSAQTMPIPTSNLASTSMFASTQEMPAVEKIERPSVSVAQPEPEKPSPKPKRASVPSWDEILFGSGSKTNE